MASVSKRGRYWRAQIVRRGYPPQYRTFDTRTEAEAWSRALESEMDRGIFASRVESEKTTLAEALQRYEREISVGKAHPQQDYQRIRHWLRQDLAHYFLANIRGADFAKESLIYERRRSESWAFDAKRMSKWILDVREGSV